jgi:hypothetical protein
MTHNEDSSETTGSASREIVTKAFGGMQVAVGGFDDGKPRVRDVDLGEWLGLAKPTDIRRSIRNLIGDGFLNDSDVARQTRRGGGAVEREVTEFWLTEAEAMIVTARSESPKAVGMVRMLVAVFEAVTSDQKRAGKILELCFQEVPRRVRARFVPLLVGISRIRGCAYDGEGAPPGWARDIARRVYEWAFPDRKQQEYRRELNPDPSASLRDYYFCTDEGLRVLDRVLQDGEAFASVAQSFAHWVDMMDHRYLDTGLQLSFLVRGELTE